MIELTMGGRCVGGLDEIAFFEALPVAIPEEIATDGFCNEYEYSLNRLRLEVRKSISISPKAHKGSFTNYTCGQCGFGVKYETDKYCRQCGRSIDWSVWPGGVAQKIGGNDGKTDCV